MKPKDAAITLVPLGSAHVQFVRPSQVQPRIADRTLLQMVTIYQRIAQKKAQREARHAQAA